MKKVKEEARKGEVGAKLAAAKDKTPKDKAKVGSTLGVRPLVQLEKPKSKDNSKRGGGSLIELGDGVSEVEGSVLDAATPKSSTNPPALTMHAGGLGDSDTAARGGGKAGTPSTPTGRSVASVVDKSKLVSQTLLHFANGGGLNVDYCFTREDSFYGAGMNTIKLVLHNTTNLPLTNVRVGQLRLEDGLAPNPSSPLPSSFS